MATALSITVLVENTANQAGLLAEHGLAFWIERGDRRVLFDTGQGMALTHNAGKLGIDLSTVDDVVLSHGHYDHTGGLLTALPSFGRATIYAHRAAFRERFARGSDNQVRSVRSPIESFDWLKPRVGQTIPTLTRPVELGAGIWLTAQIPRQNDFEDAGGAFYLDQACTQADTVVDDQAIYMETSSGIVVLLGCAHAGVVNTLNYICSLTGVSRIHAVYGGMHLLHASDQRLNKTMAVLEQCKPKVIAPCHCTGSKAMGWLRARFPEVYRDCVTGARFEFR